MDGGPRSHNYLRGTWRFSYDALAASMEALARALDTEVARVCLDETEEPRNGSPLPNAPSLPT